MNTFLIKPTNNCNLRCKYCFIENYTKSNSKIMSLDLARFIIDRIAEFLQESKQKECKILWHGGEPLLWNVSNYENILGYIYKMYPSFKWHISMQTNLTLLTEDYINIFQKYNVRLSTSMDGYAQLHDVVRVTINNKGSHHILENKLHLLAKRNIRVGLIVVLNSINADYLISIYEYYKRHNQGFRVNPLLDLGEANENKHLSISSEKFASVMINFFDYWINDSNAIPVSNFINWSSTLITRLTSSCSFIRNCQESFSVIEPNGDISVCDRFCGEKEYIYGNILNDNLAQVLQKKRNAFSERISILKQSDCKDCKYWDICYGGCPSESIGGRADINRKFKFCEAYKKIYAHIEEFILNNKIE